MFLPWHWSQERAILCRLGSKVAGGPRGPRFCPWVSGSRGWVWPGVWCPFWFLFWCWSWPGVPAWLEFWRRAASEEDGAADSTACGPESGFADASGRGDGGAEDPEESDEEDENGDGTSSGSAAAAAAAAAATAAVAVATAGCSAGVDWRSANWDMAAQSEWRRQRARRELLSTSR